MVIMNTILRSEVLLATVILFILHLILKYLM
nr:MAG TPA: hypothetical protein [Caudoviricetes sp.]